MQVFEAMGLMKGVQMILRAVVWVGYASVDGVGGSVLVAVALLFFPVFRC